MTDTVLQSFCERCGTRYTLTEQEHRPEGGLSVLGRLVKRGPEAPPGEPTVSTTLPTSDRFAGTFHFCLECRQYTCNDCWNAAAGSCIGCRPPGQVADPARVGRQAMTSGRVAPAPARPSPPATPSSPGVPSGEGWSPASGPGTSAGERPSAGASPWGSGDGVAAAILGASVGSAGSTRSASRRQDDAKDAPWASADPGTDTILDEWGRPLKRTASRDPGAAPETGPADAPKPELDPWRGVVFSAEEAGRPDKDEDRSRAKASGRLAPTATPKPEPSGWPASDQRSAAPPERPTDAMMAWPEADTRRRPPSRSEATPGPGTAPPEGARDLDAPGGADRQVVAADAPGPADRHPDDPIRAETVAAAAPAAAAAVGSEPSSEPQAAAVDASAAAPAADAIDEPPAAGAAGISLHFVDPSEVETAAEHAEPVEAAPAEPEEVVGAAPEAEVEETGSARDPAVGAEPPAAEVEMATPHTEQVEAVAEAAAETPRTEADVAEAEAAAGIVSTAAVTEQSPPEPVQLLPSADPADVPAQAPPVLPASPASPTLGPAHQSPPPPASRPAPGLGPVPPLAALPVPPPQGWGSEVASGPFSQPYTSSAPLQVPPPPSPGLPQRPPAGSPTAAVPPLGGPVVSRAPVPPSAPHPGLPPMPQPGLGPAPMAAPSPAAASMVPLPTRGERASTRACASCALPLSAKARFCRRCGAPQA